MVFKFVVVEGCDGAGKTSIRKYLFQALRDRRATPLTLTRYGYLDVDHARVLTEVKWHRRQHGPAALLRAMVGDKQQLSSRLVVPHLRHRHVIADRFVLSDLVDNQVLRGIPAETTHAALTLAGVRMPDLTLYVSTPPELAATRKAGRSGDNRNWWDEQAIQRGLHEGFERLCGPDSPVPVGRVIRIDNSGDRRETFDFLDRHVLPELIPGEPIPTPQTSAEPIPAGLIPSEQMGSRDRGTVL